MPSKKKQLNVRVSDESDERLRSLMERMKAALGIDVSQSDVIQAALLELERRYPPPPAAKSRRHAGGEK